jgi:hypothetical protein
MDPKHLRGLMEAYSEVYAPQEEIQEMEQIDEISADLVMKATKAADVKRGKLASSGDAPAAAKKAAQASRLFSKVGKLRAKERTVKLNKEEAELDEATAMAKRGHDEAPIRQKIAKSTGGGKFADKATALADKQTFRGDGSARDNLARKQRGDFRKTTSSNPGLHGYAHKSDDPKVKEKQSARAAQRSVLTPAEKKRLNREEFDIFETVLEFLCVEGYAETLDDAEWMMANIIDEEAIDIIIGEALTGDRIKTAIKKPGGTNYTRMHSADPKKRPTKRGGRGEKGASKQHDFGAADRGAGNKAARRAGKSVEDSRYEGFDAWLDEAMTNYEKNRKRAAQRAAARNAARDAGQTGAVKGVGYVTPRRERETWTDESGKTRHAKGL